MDGNVGMILTIKVLHKELHDKQLLHVVQQIGFHSLSFEPNVVCSPLIP